MSDYNRIAEAILYIKEHFKEQPELDEVAEHVHISPYHFQRIFKSWAGVSPKKFLQYISIEHAKKLLRQDLPLSEVSFETGLSGTSRLHDLFISIEGMTPGEYKNGGEQLVINFSYAESPFGDLIIASTSKGICHISFIEDEQFGIKNLQASFPNAVYNQKLDMLQQNALRIFTDDWRNISKIKLHLKGTPFQLKIWETLLRIPFGELSSYSVITKSAETPGAVRAAGSAIGNNPVAYLIPCHRVIKSTGVIGEYHWGSARKTAMIGWESARVYGES